MIIVTIISGLIKLILVLAAIFAFLLCVAGLPVGLIMLLVKFIESKKNKNTKVKKSYKLELFLILGGPSILIITFVLWAIIQLISTLFGFNIFSTILPQ